MLLKKLAEYSERLDLRPSLYSEGPVRYWVNLDREGGRTIAKSGSSSVEAGDGLC